VIKCAILVLTPRPSSRQLIWYLFFADDMISCREYGLNLIQGDSNDRKRETVL